jgi:Fur family peroxide stress response transcriptional regulator
MADPKIRLNQMATKLRERGYRITPQRLAVLKILASSKGHPGVEQIYKQVRYDYGMATLKGIEKPVRIYSLLNKE